jgi:uncharacterized protein YjbI with pentapeptide repeats
MVTPLSTVPLLVQSHPPPSPESEARLIARISGIDPGNAANLFGANLRDSDLREANLKGADLRNAKGVTEKQLEEQATKLKGATMLDGSKHN